MNKNEWLQRHTEVLAVALFLAGIFSLTLWIMQPGIGGDTGSYIESLAVLSGVSPLAAFVPIRFLTSYGALELILGVSKIVGDIFTSWLLINGLFFAVGSVSVYFLTKRFLESSFAAWGALVLYAGNYAMISFGLNYLTDMPGWALYSASLLATFLFLEKENIRYIFLASLLIGLGGLFKEYAFLAYLPLFGSLIFIYWKEKMRLLSFIFLTGVFAFLPAVIMQWSVYADYGYSYFTRLTHEQSQFGYFYSSRVVEFIKSFGSLFNFGWLIFFAGLAATYRFFQEKMDKNRLLFLILMFLSITPVFIWPGITQRVLAITLPFLALISGFAFKRFQRYWLVIGTVLFLYLLASYTMDRYILPAVSLDTLFHIL
jgi:4-amino-4-deoxy-L-arabinose transferase-like glycosyltransferase